MAKRVTIFGGSGFVGRYIVRRLADAGWQVRVAARDLAAAAIVDELSGAEAVACNITDDAQVAAALDGAEAAINCVGTFDKSGVNNFDAIQHQGAARIARLAAVAGVARMVHISAIGADAKGATLYARSKGLGEAAVRQHMPDAVILRPSVVFGPEDDFFNRFAAMAKTSPAIPLVGAGAKFQPVYVDDVAAAAAMAAEGKVAAGIYELGGPEAASFHDLMVRMLGVIERRRAVVGLPLPLGQLMGWGFDLLGAVSQGLIKGPITLDQAKSLKVDNVVTPGAKSFADLGITPTPMEAILPGYLAKYRP